MRNYLFEDIRRKAGIVEKRLKIVCKLGAIQIVSTLFREEKVADIILKNFINFDLQRGEEGSRNRLF